MDPSPIYLIGFMATGKTTVGRLVAERLGRRFVDLDETIEALAGKSVAEIFRADGEAAFRRLEARAIAESTELLDVVVACGGGAPCFGDNLSLMRRSGCVVALRASLEEVLRRAWTEAASRPLLAQAERLYAEREAVYLRADVVVDTGGREPPEIAGEVARRAAARLGAVAVKLGDRGYPIHLAPLASAGELTAELIPGITLAAVVTDENVARAGHAATVRAALERAGIRAVDVVIPPGEGAKTLATVERIADACVAAGLDRRSAILAVGGGIAGDLAGFAAAILYRGVRVAHVPTTLLAMVDAAIGGKTGADLSAGKNLVGAFWQPRYVLADVATLDTLPERERRAAMGEVVKYALLGDAPLFAELEGARPPPPADLVLRCARQKAALVARDERETTGVRALLNLGHTVGHAIEAASSYTLLHGECVALGLVAAARISSTLGLCDATIEPRIASILGALGLDADLDARLSDDVLGYVRVDKKRTGSKIKLVAIHEVGRCSLVEVAPEEIARILRSRGD